MIAPTYANVEIHILGRKERGYPARLIVGHHQHFEGGILEPGILDWVPTLSPVEDGQKLFRRLFDNEQLQQWALIRGQNPRRRIRLIIDPAAPELHAIPWELRTLTGHEASVRAVAVTPDGRRAVSASADRTLKVWDLETGHELATIVLEGSMWCVALAPDSATIVAGDAAGNVYCLRYVEGEGKH